MWLNKVGHQIVKTINLLIRVGAYLAIVALVSMMLLTVCDVFLRYAFNCPILGGMEITESMMITLAFLAIAYCALEKGNVKMDILVSRLPSRGQVAFDIVGYILCLVLSIPMAWCYLTEAFDIQRLGQVSTILRIPAYPFYLVVFFGCTMLSIVLLIELVKIAAVG
jgi:TRAP-type C4-dicarboxylate transport system permease small subunit